MNLYTILAIKEVPLWNFFNNCNFKSPATASSASSLRRYCTVVTNGCVVVTFSRCWMMRRQRSQTSPAARSTVKATSSKSLHLLELVASGRQFRNSQELSNIAIQQLKVFSQLHLDKPSNELQVIYYQSLFHSALLQGFCA